MIKCSCIYSLLLADNWQTEHTWWHSLSELKGSPRAAIQLNSCNKKKKKKHHTPNPDKTKKTFVCYSQSSVNFSPEATPQSWVNTESLLWSPLWTFWYYFRVSLQLMLFRYMWAFTVYFALGHGQESTWSIFRRVPKSFFPGPDHFTLSFPLSFHWSLPNPSNHEGTYSVALTCHPWPHAADVLSSIPHLWRSSLRPAGTGIFPPHPHLLSSRVGCIFKASVNHPLSFLLLANFFLELLNHEPLNV